MIEIHVNNELQFLGSVEITQSTCSTIVLHVMWPSFGVRVASL